MRSRRSFAARVGMTVDQSGAEIGAGRYEIGTLLGTGGMGEVRAGTDRRLGRPVAVKFLRADVAEQPGARKRFENEARAAARLTHPNVVTVYDFGEEDGRPFIVMERLPGRTLADEIAAGRLSPERVQQVAGEILGALAAAHTAGVIHRDVKPGNVLLTESGVAKVSDFGIAKINEPTDQTVTRELHMTLAYLAPERLAGEPASPRSDLYSVGVVIYEALTGSRPFAGDSPFAALQAIQDGDVVPLHDLRPDVPQALSGACERAMARDPGARFDSAAEMARALAGVPNAAFSVPADQPTVPRRVTGAADVRRRSAPTEKVAAPVLPTPPQARDATERIPARRSVSEPPPSRPVSAMRRIVAIVLGVVLFVAVATGTALVVRDANSGAPAPTPSTTQPPPAGAPQAPLPAPLADALRRLEQAVNR